jgi:hypothetical protein
MAAPVQVQGRTPLGFVQMTGMSGSTALTSIPTGAKLALIQAEAQTIRWRDDGTAPTASIGMTIAATVMLVYDGNLSRIRLIEATGGAIANVSYYA